MDKTKLNKLALQMAEDLMLARPSIPLATAIGVANYKMATICGNLRIQLDTKSGYGNTPANIYQLLLLNSGGGKGASLGLIDQFYFKDAYEYMSKVVYPKFKNKALEKLETEGNERPLHNWVKTTGSTTESGLLAYAESYDLAGVGGISIEIDEIGNAVISKSEVFELLLQPYDNGLYVPSAKRTDPNAISVSNMSTNLYCFGNKVRLFEGDIVESSFLKLLDEGYGRRMIFIDDDSIPTRKTPEDIVAEMKASESIISKREADREFIKSLITSKNLNRVLPLSDEAKYVWAIIKAEGDNYILDNRGLEPAVKSDMSERSFKVAKLAAIYAFFEGGDEVSEKNMYEALEVIEESSKVLKALRKVKPKHERLLDAMLLEDEPITSQSILAYPFIPSSWTRKIIEYIDLAKELASERGYIWDEVSRKHITYYTVNKMKSKTIEKELDNADKREKKDIEVIKEKTDRTYEEKLALLGLD